MTKKKNRMLYFIIITLFFIIFTSCSNSEKLQMFYPKAPKEIHEKRIHGEVINDYYHWLRDKTWPKIKNKRIINHLELENQYTLKYLAPYKTQENILLKEMKQKIVGEDFNYPVKHDDFYYYRKFVTGGNSFIVCRKKNSLNAKEEIVLDFNQLSMNYPGLRIGTFYQSPDQRLFAYSVDLKGEERYSISVKDLENNITAINIINNTRGNIIWDRNNKGFFYTRLDNQLRTTEVLYHEIGKKESEDKLIYKENDKSFLVNINKTSDNQYLLINSYNNEENEIRILNIEGKEGIPLTNTLILERKKGQIYGVDHGHGVFYIRINDKGKNFRLIKFKNNSFISKENIIEVIAHKDDQYLGDFSLSNEYIVVNLETNATKKIIVIDKEGNKKEVKFDEDTYDAYGHFPTYNSEYVRINYQSFLIPSSVLEYSFKEDKTYNRKTNSISGEYNKNLYKSEKIYIKADDGVQIPVSLFYKKDKFKKDGKNPLLLYGYGSYGISKYPYFDTNIFSLIDRGFIYAIAHIRGGSELGFKWYEDAKFLNKKRTFLDYIICVEGLIKKKYVNPEQVVGYGASAGGMLIGYVINERPDLLKVAVTDVPSVDVLNFMLDENLPTTPFHFSELGNPKEKKYYDYIKLYSPYDNIKEQEYPAIYATSGIYDPRVNYWQPAKWVAKLREYNKSRNPILLYTEMKTGHSGQSGRYNYLKSKAMMYNFILQNLGISVD